MLVDLVEEALFGAVEEGIVVVNVVSVDLWQGHICRLPALKHNLCWRQIPMFRIMSIFGFI